MKSIPPKQDNGLIHMLPENLWEFDGVVIRSQELTPLFVDRYNGPRQCNAMISHPYWELEFVFKGNGTLQTPDISQPLKPHRACLIPPDIFHDELSDGIMDTLWVGLQGSRLSHLDPERVYVVTEPQLDDCFERLWMRAQRPYGPIGGELDGLTATALGLFFRLFSEKEVPSVNYIDQAVQHINQHFADDISIAWLAQNFGYSESHFYRSFRKRTGKTPANYLAEVRIRNARQLLQHSSMSIKKIARIVGYQDPLYFSRVFHKLTGHNPSASRKRLKSASL